MHDFRQDTRFIGITPLNKRALLSSPTMHGEELDYMQAAYESGWMTTAGENIGALEELAASFTGTEHAVALASGTAALHLAVKLAAEKLYGSSSGISTPDGLGPGGSLMGRRVFCSDLTFCATVNPVLYEGGEPVFIDSEYQTWNMDPKALEKAFGLYPEVRLVVLVHLYGTTAQTEEILRICQKHNALLIEDAAEALGASCAGRPAGSLGDYGVISFNGNKIITGSSGGMLLTKDAHSADRVRKWSTQSREAAPWYQHEELGYNYRISNLVAGVARGQWMHLEEHIKRKKDIFFRYQEALRNLPVSMNPTGCPDSVPNYWLSCLLLDREALCESERSECGTAYRTSSGSTCPAEILEALESFNAEGRPLWKPMHLQPMYRNNGFVTAAGSGRGSSCAYIPGTDKPDVGADLFRRGLCLPSDIKMTQEQQDTVIEVVRRCFL